MNSSPLSLASRTQSSSSLRAQSSIPPKRASIPPSRLTPLQKKEMFERAEEADRELEEAKLVERTRLMARSAIVQEILAECGPGPFMYKGQQVRIVKRDEVYFFRLVSKDTPEEIG